MKINKICILAILTVLLASCSASTDIEGLPEMDQQTRVKFNQYYRDGRVLYVAYCSSCHMENGEGLKNAIPALNKPKLYESRETVPCQIKYGSMEHENVEVGPGMQGFYSLSNLEIAEITTYISSSWGNKKGLMPVKEVNKLLDLCKTPN